MSAVENSDASEHHASAAVAVAAEKRWALIVGAIMVSILAMMIFTGLHYAAMPPSRVETVDVKTLHIQGEFVENNLGTAIDATGKVVVRLIAQQDGAEKGDEGDPEVGQHETFSVEHS